MIGLIGVVLMLGALAYVIWAPMPDETAKEKKCKCDACTQKPDRAHNPLATNGLHLWVGEDGELHYKKTSRIL